MSGQFFSYVSIVVGIKVYADTVEVASPVEDAELDIYENAHAGNTTGNWPLRRLSSRKRSLQQRMLVMSSRVHTLRLVEPAQRIPTCYSTRRRGVAVREKRGVVETEVDQIERELRTTSSRVNDDRRTNRPQAVFECSGGRRSKAFFSRIQEEGNVARIAE